MKFMTNFNEKVKVKLTNYGVQILEERRQKLNEFIKTKNGKGLGDYKLKVDDEGYTSFQIWELMNTFGDAMQLGTVEPFHGDMLFMNGKVIEQTRCVSPHSENH